MSEKPKFFGTNFGKVANTVVVYQYYEGDVIGLDVQYVRFKDYDQVCRERDELKDQLDDRYNTTEQALHDQYTEKIVPLALELQKYKDWVLMARAFLAEVHFRGFNDDDESDHNQVRSLVAQFPSPERQESDE